MIENNKIMDKTREEEEAAVEAKKDDEEGKEITGEKTGDNKTENKKVERQDSIQFDSALPYWGGIKNFGWSWLVWMMNTYQDYL